jgi:thiamine-monophosphate kinase
MHESDLIRQLAACFRRSPRQRNDLFTCDAEIIDLGGSLWGITTDAFSPDEDCFGSADPVRIGRNIAVATLSDLFASGCQPHFYLHSIELPPDGEAFGLQLSQGVATILDACGAYMLGGDLGCGGAWRCAATALGPVAGSDPVTRLLPHRAQALYVTGTLGDANAAALQGLLPPEFELRLAAAAAMRQQASACIDTSDGLLHAVWQWSGVNPGFRFDLTPAAIPYAQQACESAQRFHLPLPAFLLGGAGEYELLFAADFRSEVPDATRIGTVAPDPVGGVFFGASPLCAAPPDPRSFPDRPSYLAAILAQLSHWSVPPGRPSDTGMPSSSLCH